MATKERGPKQGPISPRGEGCVGVKSPKQGPISPRGEGCEGVITSTIDQTNITSLTYGLFCLFNIFKSRRHNKHIFTMATPRYNDILTQLWHNGNL